MFHLLTAVTDGAFPRQRRPSPETARDLAQPSAEMPALARAVRTADSSPLLSITAGPAHTASWYKPILCCGLLPIALLVGLVAAEDGHAQGAASPSRAAKIANALTAAPEEVSRNATVKDWPAKEGDGFALLRQGTNGWVCVPDDPTTRGNDPMCMDETFHAAVAAFLTGQKPTITRVGYAYMLTSDAEGSNIDPREQSPTPTNQWHHAGPHVMLLYPDSKLLEGVPTKPSAYGPYVMFPGTPIAHVMLPVQSGYAHPGSHNASGRTGSSRR